MLPIAVYPSVVEKFLPKVQNGFSKPQLKQFARCLKDLIVCDNKTVSAINNSHVCSSYLLTPTFFARRPL
jgi:hypothetical protein